MLELPAVASRHRVRHRLAIALRFPPTLGMRIPSHQHQLLGRAGDVVAHHLWEVAYEARYLSARPLVERATVEDDGAGGRTPQSGYEIEKGALAGTVPSHQRNELARSDRETHAVENGNAPRAPACILYFEDRCHDACTPWSQRAMVSAASTTRGPGTTKMSLVTA